MSYTIAKLRTLSDEQLILEHDEQAQRTVVGTDYYVEELDRRSRERAIQAANELAARSHTQATWSTVLSIVATVAAVLALFLR